MTLDDINIYKNLDTSNIFSSIGKLPDQINFSWNETDKVLDKCNIDFKSISNIVFSGMGGSALGAKFVKSLFLNQIRTPLEIVNDNKMPFFANANTLTIISSYSGNTKETVEALHDAVSKNNKIIGITAGGELEELFTRFGISFLKIDPSLNPCGQPRLGVGYTIGFFLKILQKSGTLSIDNESIENAIKTCGVYLENFDIRIPHDTNPAKKLAFLMKNKAIVLVASKHLVGVTQVMKNQINENAKAFAVNFEVPELDHHLLEGLKNPGEMSKLGHFVLLQSKNYDGDTKKRFKIVADILEKQGYTQSFYETRSENKIDDAFECLTLGSFVSYYLAILYNQNPTPIPWVDYFKKEFEK